MRVEEITRALKAAVVTVVSDETTHLPSVRLSPNSESLNFSKEAEIPCVVLQGPRVRANRHDYTKREDNGVDPGTGVKQFEIRKHRQIVDLVFRVRIFARTLTGAEGALTIVDDIASSAGSLESLVVVHADGETVTYGVELDDSFADDLTPNESDLKHYESEMVVEEVELRPEDADETAWELKTWDVVGEQK